IGGGHHVPRVIADLSSKEKITAASLFSLGYHYSVPLDKWNIADMACDYLYLGDNTIDFEIPGTLGLIYNYKTWLSYKDESSAFPFLTTSDYLNNNKLSERLSFIKAELPDVNDKLIDKLKYDSTAVLVIETSNEHGLAEQRRLFV